MHRHLPVSTRLPKAEPVHRIDARRRPQREPARNERHGDQHERCHYKRQAVADIDAEEETLSDTARHGCHQQAAPSPG